jgi:hypothetical protein
MCQDGLASGYAGTLGSIVLRPGLYTLQVQYDGDALREITVDMEQGAEKVVSP